MWTHECINDLYESGFTSDKLPLLFKENENANVAVKTPNGMTDRMKLKDVVLQGTVWGGMNCTASIDKLGQMAYKKEDPIYLYKGKVKIPPLSMVDDICLIQKCKESFKGNAVVNSFVETKKLKLSDNKCHRIHVGKQNGECPELNVHGKKMADSLQEKYLGDLYNQTGNAKATVSERVARGYSIIADIKVIITEIPLGRSKLEMGLELRQAMLINGVLFNSEAWHSMTKKDVTDFEKLDEMLLRFLLSAHSKTPLEMLYLESGAIPVKFILASRRLNYFYEILDRDEEELTKRVVMEQIENTLDGDFVDLVRKDCEKLQLKFETDCRLSKDDVKEKVRNAAFSYLKALQETHSKSKGVKYSHLETQNYLTSSLFDNEETKILFSLRTKMHEGFKANFPSMHMEKSCPLTCEDEDNLMPDSQEHLFQCKKLSKVKINGEYKHLYSIHEEEIKIFLEDFKRLTDLRKMLCQQLQLAPSTSPDALCCGDDNVNMLPYGM